MPRQPVDGLPRMRGGYGRPGLVASLDGEIIAVIATEARAGRVTDIWMTVNPDKLRAWERHG
ncbi:RNA polymerase sigma-70 factor, ECF subfamily [Streptosporangium subroseum]|uniref:RNA polymerase sigma-70 factor, ECF subfamily n=1 Tax=Streptosporangium subroseum TaxID=106412 RepID=A0A239CRT5_9ACTN|nr:hypothetical protein [Streptosporangium subroseum]SNS22807.1 RNA polymerase sigma-70 factor, ECF subfamily [Streptosporangium subroseum]